MARRPPNDGASWSARELKPSKHSRRRARRRGRLRRSWDARRPRYSRRPCVPEFHFEPPSAREPAARDEVAVARAGDAVALSLMLPAARRLRWLGAQLCAATLMLAVSLGVPAAPQAHAPLKIGIIGSGHIGGTLASCGSQSGHEVLISSRHPDKLKALAASLGPQRARRNAARGGALRRCGRWCRSPTRRCRSSARICEASSPARSCSTPAIPIRNATARWRSRTRVAREPGWLRRNFYRACAWCAPSTRSATATWRRVGASEWRAGGYTARGG